MDHQKILVIIAVLLVGIFTIMLTNQDNNIGDQINEGAEEVADEIDDAVSQ